MSLVFQNAELKYPKVDKKDFVVFNVVKHFTPYLLKIKEKGNHLIHYGVELVNSKGIG